MSTDAFGNLDIWTNILQYFKISLELDSESEAKEKRKCLLRVALLSPSLTTPALDLLWQNMTSLVPVTQVINVNLAFLPLFPVLRFTVDHGGFWTLTCPNIPNNIRRRVDKYLSRIQHLRLIIGPPKETGAVSILSMALGVNPLLPRLKSLDLDSRQWQAVGTWIYAIGTLISPSLTSISYTAVAAAQFEGVMTVQSVLS
ncbi:hypothetical protein Agabi119p4_9070 [Agaricus bisporus var. burnettii]|uniref:Uncharacterized protein n=1 Tax=Agaricus bisporus var. burnettii TaxID=192524 RepID=A0A8H7EY12_AGABI|nr:hypothetical protein Agabi119p4_9070 [Agaricus bisporus var. burnettii]